MKQDTYNTSNLTVYIIKIDLSQAILPTDFVITNNLLFASKYSGEIYSLRNLINTISLFTKMVRKSPNTDLSTDSLAIFYKFDNVKLPRIRSDLISIYDSNLDERQIKYIENTYHLMNNNTQIRLLQVVEQVYLSKQIENYVENRQKLDKIEVLTS